MTHRLLLLLLASALVTPALAKPGKADAQTAAKVDAPATAAALPDGRELLFKEVNAAGSATLDTLKGLHMEGTFSMPAQGLNAKMSIWRAAPNLMRTRIEIDGIGVIEEGFDGTRAWANDPIQGPRIRSGAEGEEAAFTAVFAGDAHPERYTDVQTLESAEFAGRPAFKIKVKPPGDIPVRFLWIDAETFRTLGAETTAPSPMGEIPVTMTMGDVRDVGNGLLMPFTMSQSMMNTEQTIQLTAVTLDPELPDFAAPAAVQELIKADEAAAKAAAEAVGGAKTEGAAAP